MFTMIRNFSSSSKILTKKNLLTNSSKRILTNTKSINDDKKISLPNNTTPVFTTSLIIRRNIIDKNGHKDYEYLFFERNNDKDAKIFPFGGTIKGSKIFESAFDYFQRSVNIRGFRVYKHGKTPPEFSVPYSTKIAKKNFQLDKEDIDFKYFKLEDSIRIVSNFNLYYKLHPEDKQLAKHRAHICELDSRVEKLFEDRLVPCNFLKYKWVHLRDINSDRLHFISRIILKKIRDGTDTTQNTSQLKKLTTRNAALHKNDRINNRFTKYINELEESGTLLTP